MSTLRSSRPAARSIVVAAGVLLSVVVGGLWVVDLGTAERDASVRGRVVAEAASIRAALEDELVATVHLARGIRGFVVATPEVADPDHPAAARVDDLLAAVYDDGRHVRNIGLAPDNVLRYVHPLEGNEAALGLRYEDVPAQWADVERAMRTGTSVLAGPVELVQGGTGLVNRTPVELVDGTYWGIVSLVVDLPSLLAAVEARVADRDVRWAVRTTDADGGVPVTGDQALFDRADAVLVDVAAAEDSRWELVAVPSELLLEGYGWPPAVERALVVLLAVVLAGLVLSVSEERRLVRALSIHDPLTGLPNRRLLVDRLEQAVATAGRRGGGFAVLFLDLDGFKPVNDEHGHAAGDAVLCTVADRLRHATRGVDTVARVGGDEFVVLLAEEDDVERAARVAERLRAVVGLAVQLPTGAVHVDASIGIALHPDDGATVDELLLRADQAMYEGKRAGKGRVELAAR